MSPADIFGIAIRVLAISMIFGALSALFVGAIGVLSPLVVGTILLLLARPLTAFFYSARIQE
jgi:hypothetical protein